MQIHKLVLLLCMFMMILHGIIYIYFLVHVLKLFKEHSEMWMKNGVNL